MFCGTPDKSNIVSSASEETAVLWRDRSVIYWWTTSHNSVGTHAVAAPVPVSRQIDEHERHTNPQTDNKPYLCHFQRQQLQKWGGQTWCWVVLQNGSISVVKLARQGRAFLIITLGMTPFVFILTMSSCGMHREAQNMKSLTRNATALLNSETNSPIRSQQNHRTFNLSARITNSCNST